MFVGVADKRQEFSHYQKIQMLKGFNFEGFLRGLREGFVLVDFDARTGHNHGTKFRLRQNHLPDLYEIRPRNLRRRENESAVDGRSYETGAEGEGG